MPKLYSDETFRSRKFSFEGIHLLCAHRHNAVMKEKQLTEDEIAKNRHTLRFVKPWMKLRGLTQRKLSEELGMSEPSVSKWLNGKVNMTLSQFTKVAELLNANPEDLLFDPKEKDKASKYKEAAELAESLEPEAFHAWITAGKAMRKKE